MRVVQRVIFRFPPPAQPVDAALAYPERGVFVLVHHASKWSHAHVLAAVERAVQTYLDEDASAAASEASVHALVERIAAAAGGTGVPEATPEFALAWVHEGDAYLATIGTCAVVRCTRAGLEPLHSLDTLAQANPDSGMGRTAHRIAVQMLGMDPREPTAGVAEQHAEFERGDILMLVSPRIAIPMIEFGMRPAATLDDLDAWAQWLATLVEVDAERPEDAVGALLLVQRDG